MMFTASRQCSSGYRKCPNTGRCIDEDWFCDGDDDCGDMSDETGCRKLQATAATTVIQIHLENKHFRGIYNNSQAA